jgi:Ca2+-binding EF-hand superfamily protein
MKSFSNGIFAILFLILPFGAGYLHSQSDDGAESSQPESRPGILEIGSGYEGLWDLMDADQDGLITQDEWQRVFANHDENGDNRLSKSEIESIPVEGGGTGMPDPDQGRLEAFNRLDVNGNNVIDSPEWPGKEEAFSSIDANLNGSLSREEFLSINGRFWNQPFENLDFNADGIIESSEWLDSDKSFDRLDRDRNGMVERREFYNPR